MDSGDSSESAKLWLDLDYIVKVNPGGFANELHVELLFAAMKKTIGGVDLGEDNKNFILRVSLRRANGNTKQAVEYESRI